MLPRIKNYTFKTKWLSGGIWTAQRECSHQVNDAMRLNLFFWIFDYIGVVTLGDGEEQKPSCMGKVSRRTLRRLWLCSMIAHRRISSEASLRPGEMFRKSAVIA